jgi:hypothetical protein
MQHTSKPPYTSLKPTLVEPTCPWLKDVKKALNSLIILGSWTLWQHRKDCVFNGAYPRLSMALTMVGEEARAWSLACAKGFSLLTGQDGAAAV